MNRPPKTHWFTALPDIAAVAAAIIVAYIGAADAIKYQSGLFALMYFFLAGTAIAFASVLWVQLRLVPYIFIFSSDPEQRTQIAATPMPVGNFIWRYFRKPFISAVLPVVIGLVILGTVFLYVSASKKVPRSPFEVVGLISGALMPTLISLAGACDLLARRFRKPSSAQIFLCLAWAAGAVVIPFGIFVLMEGAPENAGIKTLVLFVADAILCVFIRNRWRNACRAFSEV